MAEVVLFHHIRGLTAGVAGLAERLAGPGHTVHTADLFEGRTFDSIEAGNAYVEEVGSGALLQRGQRAVADLPGALVYAGISMGVLHAELATLLRPGARGAILLEGAGPVEAFADVEAGLEWPEEVPFQIHGMDNDPFFAGEGDIATARELVSTLPAGQLFIYPGNVHLFCDVTLASYDPGATSLVLERVEEFLVQLDAAG